MKVIQARILAAEFATRATFTDCESSKRWGNSLKEVGVSFHVPVSCEDIGWLVTDTRVPKRESIHG